MEHKIEIKKTFTFTGHNAGIYALCEGMNENCVISGSADKYIAQWNILSGQQEKFSAKLPAAVYSLLPIYHLHQLWVGTGNGHIHVIDTKKNEELHAFRFHTLAVFDIKYSEEQNLVYSSGADGLLNVYDPVSLHHKHSMKLSSEKIRSILIHQREIYLAEGSGRTLVLDLNSFEIKADFVSHKHATNCYWLNEQENVLISGGRDAHLNFWDLKHNFHRLNSIPAHNFAIYKIIELEGKELIATASRDKTIKLWDKENFEIVKRINKENDQGHAHSVNNLFWNKNLQTLVSAGDDRVLMSWKLMDCGLRAD